jgi:hypothetical protein
MGHEAGSQAGPYAGIQTGSIQQAGQGTGTLARPTSGKWPVIGVVGVVVLYLVIAAAAGLAPFSSKPHSSGQSANYAAVLQSKIPNSQTCFAATAATLKYYVPNAKAAVVCTPVAGGPEVAYAIYPNSTTAETEFESALAHNAPASLAAGNCSQGNDSVGNYSSNNVVVGRQACFVSGAGAQWMIWIHYSDNILAETEGPTLNLTVLLQEFPNFGPK